MLSFYCCEEYCQSRRVVYASIYCYKLLKKDQKILSLFFSSSRIKPVTMKTSENSRGIDAFDLCSSNIVALLLLFVLCIKDVVIVFYLFFAMEKWPKRCKRLWLKCNWRLYFSFLCVICSISPSFRLVEKCPKLDTIDTSVDWLSGVCFYFSVQYTVRCSVFIICHDELFGWLAPSCLVCWYSCFNFWLAD